MPNFALGVSIAHLQTLMDQHPDVSPTISTQQLYEHVVAPLLASATARHPSFEATYVNLLTQLDPASVGPATYFVCHACEQPFSSMLEAITEAASANAVAPNTETNPQSSPPPMLLETSTSVSNKNVFVWIDIFCAEAQFLNDINTLRPFLAANELRTALCQIGQVLVVLDPWDKPSTMRRPWPIWTVFMATYSINNSINDTIIDSNNYSSSNPATLQTNPTSNNDSSISSSTSSSSSSGGIDTHPEQQQRVKVIPCLAPKEMVRFLQTLNNRQRVEDAVSRMCRVNIEKCTRSQPADHAVLDCLTSIGAASGTQTDTHIHRVNHAVQGILCEFVSGHCARVLQQSRLDVENSPPELVRRRVRIQALLLNAMRHPFELLDQRGLAISLCTPIIDFHRTRKDEKNFAEVIPIELQWLGELQAELGRYGEASETLHEALDMLEPTDPSRAEPMCVLASIYSRQSDFQSAAEIYESALGIERGYLDDEPELAITINNLADVYAVLGRFDEALPLLKEAWVINCNHMNPSRSREMHLDGRRLASLLIARGQFGPARAVLDAVVDHPGKVDHRGRARAMLVPPGTPRSEFHIDLYRLCVCMLLDETNLYRAAKLIQFAMAICLEESDKSDSVNGAESTCGSSIGSRSSSRSMCNSNGAFSGVSGGGRDLRKSKNSVNNDLPKYTWLASDIERARGQIESAELLQAKSIELAKAEWEKHIFLSLVHIQREYLHMKTEALQQTVTNIQMMRQKLSVCDATVNGQVTSPTDLCKLQSDGMQCQNIDSCEKCSMSLTREGIVRALIEQDFVLTDLLNEVGILMVVQGNGQGLKNLEASYERRTREVGQGGALPFLRELADAYARVANFPHLNIGGDGSNGNGGGTEALALRERGASFLYSLVQLVHTQRALQNPHDSELADLRAELGTILLKLGIHFQVAETVLTQALETYQSLHGMHDTRSIQTMFTVARLLVHKQQLKHALPLLQLAIQNQTAIAINGADTFLVQMRHELSGALMKRASTLRKCRVEAQTDNEMVLQGMLQEEAIAVYEAEHVSRGGIGAVARVLLDKSNALQATRETVLEREKNSGSNGQIDRSIFRHSECDEEKREEEEDDDDDEDDEDDGEEGLNEEEEDEEDEEEEGSGCEVSGGKSESEGGCEDEEEEEEEGIYANEQQNGGYVYRNGQDEDDSESEDEYGDDQDHSESEGEGGVDVTDDSHTFSLAHDMYAPSIEIQLTLARLYAELASILYYKGVKAEAVSMMQNGYKIELGVLGEDCDATKRSRVWIERVHAELEQANALQRPSCDLLFLHTIQRVEQLKQAEAAGASAAAELVGVQSYGTADDSRDNDAAYDDGDGGDSDSDCDYDDDDDDDDYDDGEEDDDEEEEEEEEEEDPDGDCEEYGGDMVGSEAGHDAGDYVDPIDVKRVDVDGIDVDIIRGDVHADSFIDKVIDSGVDAADVEVGVGHVINDRSQFSKHDNTRNVCAIAEGKSVKHDQHVKEDIFDKQLKEKEKEEEEGEQHQQQHHHHHQPLKQNELILEQPQSTPTQMHCDNIDDSPRVQSILSQSNEKTDKDRHTDKVNLGSGNDACPRRIQTIDIHEQVSSRPNSDGELGQVSTRPSVSFSPAVASAPSDPGLMEEQPLIDLEQDAQCGTPPSEPNNKAGVDIVDNAVTTKPATTKTTGTATTSPTAASLATTRPRTMSTTTATYSQTTETTTTATSTTTSLAASRSAATSPTTTALTPATSDQSQRLEVFTDAQTSSATAVQMEATQNDNATSLQHTKTSSADHTPELKTLASPSSTSSPVHLAPKSSGCCALQ